MENSAGQTEFLLFFFFKEKKLAKHAMGARNPQLGCWSDSHRPAELGSLPTVDLIGGKL